MIDPPLAAQGRLQFRRRSPATVAAGDAVRKAEIKGATIAGGHGTTAKQAEIAAALAAN